MYPTYVVRQGTKGFLFRSSTRGAGGRHTVKRMTLAALAAALIHVERGTYNDIWSKKSNWKDTAIVNAVKASLRGTGWDEKSAAVIKCWLQDHIVPEDASGKSRTWTAEAIKLFKDAVAVQKDRGTRTTGGTVLNEMRRRNPELSAGLTTHKVAIKLGRMLTGEAAATNKAKPLAPVTKKIRGKKKEPGPE